MQKDYRNEFYLDDLTNNLPVVRWKSNDQIPFDDMLADFLVAGLIDDFTMLNSIATRKYEDVIFLEQYVQKREKYGYSDEEKFEMRAAFGNEEVVDVFTGKSVAYN